MIYKLGVCMRNIIFSAVLILTASNSFSDGFYGKVKGFYVNNSNTVLVTLDQGGKQPACDSTNGWQFKFDSTTEHAKTWISMLLASRMAQSEIRVGYIPSETGACSVTNFYFYDY